ncbi:metallophosphoesterase family protein [Aquicoccus sp. SU-CL01552]|uniref:metallophosphoesterase family protein n=1 Tax=Aquicoccus sp. SU-CL01552 TaxID=3127656 RepID=UPI0033415566
MERAPRPTAPIAPDRAFCVIGDIHGRADLLLELGEKVAGLALGLPMVFVGDYIDRGDQSAEVLRLLHAAWSDNPEGVHCLMGNHEAMCLAFLDDPEKAGPRWMRHGGLQTLASFGIGDVGEVSSGATYVRARDALALAMGDPLIEWMRGLPLRWSSGNVTVVHAGADPARPLDAQDSRTLLWGHRDFISTPRDDGQWVVHGHTIVDAPLAEAGRIAIDTGAYATGTLTAALCDESGAQFVST